MCGQDVFDKSACLGQLHNGMRKIELVEYDVRILFSKEPTSKKFFNHYKVFGEIKSRIQDVNLLLQKTNKLRTVVDSKCYAFACYTLIRIKK